jgi:hypothetical protein
MRRPRLDHPDRGWSLSYIIHTSMIKKIDTHTPKKERLPPTPHTVSTKASNTHIAPTINHQNRRL